MTRTVRLALLACDKLNPAVAAKDGPYPALYDRLFRSALEAFPDADVEFSLDSFDVRDEMKYPENPDVYDGMLLSGSAASAYENLEWINTLVAYVASIAEEKPKIKLIGICFGHQIISRALGKACVPNEGKWEVGPTLVQLTDAGKQLFGTDELSIQQMHRDHVPEVPDGCTLIGLSPIAPNQGYIRSTGEGSDPKSIQIFTIQGHPEFTEGVVSALVDLRESTGLFDAALANNARERMKWRNDGVTVVGKAIWRIFGLDG